MKLRNILAIGVLIAGSLSSCSEPEKGTFVGTLANSEISQLLEDKDTEPIPTDTRISAGIAYFYISGLDMGRNLKTDRVYTRLMKLNNRERIKQEIDFFADYEFGNPKNGWTTTSERNKAYEALKRRWYFEEYKHRLGNRLLLQVLNDYEGFARGF